MHIGKMIREVLREQGMTVTAFAKLIPCSRENAHRLLNRAEMSTGLLIRLSLLLNHDFFLDISQCNHFVHSDRSRHKVGEDN